MIFLQLIFYLKSAIVTHSKVLNLDIFIFCTFWRLEFSKLAKFRALKIAKNGSFTTSKILHNWFHVKYEWQKNPVISTPWKGTRNFHAHCLTVWKFQWFSVIHILREIKICHFYTFKRFWFLWIFVSFKGWKLEN